MSLANLVDSLLMVPFSVRSHFVDSEEPFSVHVENKKEIARPDRQHLLVVASEGWDDMYMDKAEMIFNGQRNYYDSSMFLHDPLDVRYSLAFRLEDLSRTRGTKVVIYSGHAKRQHPRRGNRFYLKPGHGMIPDDLIQDIIKRDPDPWIFLIHAPYGGLLAKNLANRPNTIAISSCSERAKPPDNDFIRSVAESSNYENLEDAFTQNAHMYHKNSFLFWNSEAHMYGDRMYRFLERLDRKLRLSKSEKQLFANGIDPKLYHIGKPR